MESIISKNRKEAIERLIIESADIAKTKGVSIEVVLKCYELTEGSEEFVIDERQIRNEIDQDLFWSLFSRKIKSGELIENFHFRIIDGYLLLRLSHVYSLFKDSKHSFLSGKLNFESMLRRSRGFKGVDKQKFKSTEKAQILTVSTSAFKFDLFDLKIDL